MPRQLNGDSFYQDLSSLEDPDDQIDRMLDMVEGIDQLLEDWMSDAVDDQLEEDDPSGFQRIESAQRAATELYDRLKALQSAAPHK